jgi:hypothetical protein
MIAKSFSLRIFQYSKNSKTEKKHEINEKQTEFFRRTYQNDIFRIVSLGCCLNIFCMFNIHAPLANPCHLKTKFSLKMIDDFFEIIK